MSNGGLTEEIVRHARHRVVRDMFIVGVWRFCRTVEEINLVCCQAKLQCACVTFHAVADKNPRLEQVSTCAHPCLK